MPDIDINIFAFTDFRFYLAEYYRTRKALDGKFSHRFIKEKAGASSSGWFADVLKGRANLNSHQVVKVARLLGLKANQEDYFEAMVYYGQAMSMEERNRHFRKMMAFKEVKSDVVGMDKLEFYSKWYHSALREILFFHRFDGDYAALARKLSPPIRQSEAKESIKLLERLGFVEEDEHGGYRAKEATLKKDATFPSIVMANFLKANMELGIEAVDRYPKDARDISAVTLSLSDEAFAKVRDEIRALRKRILAMTEADPHPTKVYQCNFQFFPLSQ
jgi:uncharacterized protein (TIGR02147 family)